MDSLPTFPNRKQNVLSRLFVVFFSVSLVFPLVAAFLNLPGHRFMEAGIADVGLALICLLLLALLWERRKNNQPQQLSRRAIHILQGLHSLPLLLIALYLAPVALNWEVLLIGLGWRYWLLLTALPLIAPASRPEGRCHGL
ncbi:hypothetical protein ACS5NO_28250 [Larkinella sp. GY13]|uniref:hypothetical protein n=1 Tax=Larkinella sp. GY13 TaxID=3453720 RepID=UPI003EEC92C7